jgi:hypothetical protein
VYIWVVSIWKYRIAGVVASLFGTLGGFVLIFYGSPWSILLMLISFLGAPIIQEFLENKL